MPYICHIYAIAFAIKISGGYGFGNLFPGKL
jgi:hypothetical protein